MSETYTMYLGEKENKRGALWHHVKVVDIAIQTNNRDFPWLRCHTSNAGGTGSVPGQGTNIPQAVWPPNPPPQIKQMKKKKTSGGKKHYYPCFSDETGLREITAQVTQGWFVGWESDPRAQFCSRALYCQTNSQTQNKAGCLFLATLREVCGCGRVGYGRDSGDPYVY